MSGQWLNGIDPRAGGIDSPVYSPATASAFGTPETDHLTPIVQGDFVYGINMQIWQPAVTSGTGATVDTDNGNLRIQSGTDAAGYAYIQSERVIKYRAGQGCKMRMTPLFTTGVADSLQLWGAGAVVSNEPYDGYFFGFNGADYGVVHYARGAVVGEFVTQANWNGNKCPWLDPTKGTPVQIVWPYLGYGNVSFMIQEPNTGYWVLAHTIRYANKNTVTQMSNPSIFILGFVKNSGNTSNLTMRAGSVAGFISGQRSYTADPRWSAKNNKSAITTETNLLAIKNATTYNGVANRGLIRLLSMSVSGSAGNGIASFDLVFDPTLGGTPAYTPISGSTADNGVTITSGDSLASYDVAGTTITGGTRRHSVTVDNPNSEVIDLIHEDLFITPGQVMSIAGTSTVSSVMGVSLNWSEDI